MKTLHKVVVATAAVLTMGSAAFAATISIGSGINLAGLTASGSDAVTVSGTVNPVLSMTVSGTTLDFGTLVLGSANTLSNATDVSVLSNASNGFSVDATFADLARVGGGATIPFTVNGHAATGGNIINQASYSTTAVAQSVNYVATPAANQMAGSYGTTVTYTVTGNF